MIGNRIKTLRTLNGLTQKDLAERLNVTTQAISKWESGRALPSVEYLPNIADVFECSIDTLFSDYEIEVYQKFKPLSDKEMVDFLATCLVSKCDRNANSSPNVETDAIRVIDIGGFPVESMFLPSMHEYLKEQNTVSISKLQRKFRLGFAFAGKIVDSLEKMGIVRFDGLEKGYIIDKSKVDLLLPLINTHNN